jgi:hypothetical protein
MLRTKPKAVFLISPRLGRLRGESAERRDGRSGSRARHRAFIDPDPFILGWLRWMPRSAQRGINHAGSFAVSLE